MNNVLKTAQAGTLESNDIMITVAPGRDTSGIHVELDSIVLKQYGEAIHQIILDLILEHEIADIYVKAIDRGALNCTIRARMLTALQRSGIVLKEGTL